MPNPQSHSPSILEGRGGGGCRRRGLPFRASPWPPSRCRQRRQRRRPRTEVAEAAPAAAAAAAAVSWQRGRGRCGGSCRSGGGCRRQLAAILPAGVVNGGHVRWAWPSFGGAAFVARRPRLLVVFVVFNLVFFWGGGGGRERGGEHFLVSRFEIVLLSVTGFSSGSRSQLSVLLGLSAHALLSTRSSRLRWLFYTQYLGSGLVHILKI